MELKVCCQKKKRITGAGEGGQGRAGSQTHAEQSRCVTVENMRLTEDSWLQLFGESAHHLLVHLLSSDLLLYLLFGFHFFFYPTFSSFQWRFDSLMCAQSRLTAPALDN